MSILMTIVASIFIIVCVVVLFLLHRETIRQEVAEELYKKVQSMSVEDISEYIRYRYSKDVILFIILMLLFILAL